MSISIYMATHQKIEHIPFDYIIPIHVGAALRDENFPLLQTPSQTKDRWKVTVIG